jgi:hypothetical protein
VTRYSVLAVSVTLMVVGLVATSQASQTGSTGSVPRGADLNSLLQPGKAPAAAIRQAQRAAKTGATRPSASALRKAKRAAVRVLRAKRAQQGGARARLASSTSALAWIYYRTDYYYGVWYYDWYYESSFPGNYWLLDWVYCDGATWCDGVGFYYLLYNGVWYGPYFY